MSRCLMGLSRMPLARPAGLSLSFALLVASLSAVAAETILFTDSAAWPGSLSRTAGRGESLFYRRPDSLSEAGAIPRLQSVVVSPAGRLYFASGLDGHIWSLVGGRERLVYRHDGQIRHLSWGHDERSLLFSVVPTPRDAAPLADGEIFSLNLATGEARRFATVRQRDVAGGFWGALATYAGRTFIATLQLPSRVYELTGDGPVEVHISRDVQIHGMAFSPRAALHLADGEHRIWWVDSDGTQRVAYDVGARNVNHLAFVGAEPRGSLPPIIPGVPDFCPPSVDPCPPGRLPIPIPIPLPIPRPDPRPTPPLSPLPPVLPPVHPVPPLRPLPPLRPDLTIPLRPELRLPPIPPRPDFRLPDGLLPGRFTPPLPPTPPTPPMPGGSLGDRLRIPDTIISPLTPRVGGGGMPPIRPIPGFRLPGM